MKAIVVREFGEPETMKLADLPVPSPGPGQVLVKVAAAGVNPADTYMRAGGYGRNVELPYTPGTDGAGVVEAVGSGVKRVRPGDRVYLARSLSGTYAEYALALESQARPLPERIGFSEGAGIYVPYATAYRALFHLARASGGETVLVHGASGGVGIAAIQLARAQGLVAIGTAGSERGLGLAQREGAQLVVNHGSPGYKDEILEFTGGRGVDVILEMLANVNLGEDLKMLAMRGRVVVIGSRGNVTVNPRDLMGKDGSVMGMLLWNLGEEEADRIHPALFAGLENGSLRPIVGLELPLAEAARAHRKVMESGAYGKIVLLP